MKQPIFISLQGSYSNLEVSLNKGLDCIQVFKEDNLHASSSLVPKIKDLLNENSFSLNDLDFIAVDQGPGAFTSLRVVITIVNAFSFANKVPLIGIDGLEALYFQALHNFDSENVVAILNAYNNDVYYFFKFKNIWKKGYKKINLLISELKKLYYTKNIVFVGNAYKQHKDLLVNLNHSYINLQTVSVSQISKMALKRWEKNKVDVSFKLTPLYLKTQSFATRKH